MSYSSQRDLDQKFENSQVNNITVGKTYEEIKDSVPNNRNYRVILDNGPSTMDHVPGRVNVHVKSDPNYPGNMNKAIVDKIAND